MANDDNQLALEAATAEVARAPEDPDAWLRLGQAHQGLRHFDKAVDAFRRAHELRPDYPVASAALAIALVNDSQAKDAIPLAREAVDADPNDARFHAALAFALHEAGSNEDALAEADRALELSPADVFVESVRSSILLALGRTTDAFEAARRLERAQPNSPAVVRLLARAALAARRFEATEASARHLLDLDPFAEEAYLFLGLALSEQRAFRDAEDAFRKGLDRRANDPELLNGLAYVLALQGRHQEAEPLARRSVALKESWYAIGTLAVTLLGLGDAYKDRALYGEAREYLNRAILLAASDQSDVDEEAKLYLQRGYAYARLGEFDRARGDFRTAVSKARPLSAVSLAAGRNLRRLEVARWQGSPAPGWLPHTVAVAAALLLLFASILILANRLSSGSYATIAVSSFGIVFIAYSLPTLTKLTIGVVELERVAAPLPEPHIEILP